jgi:hypothetical protein
LSKHQSRSISELVEQVGEHLNAAARRGRRRRARLVSGPWDIAANRNEHQLAPPPDDGPAPEHPSTQGERL